MGNDQKLFAELNAATKEESDLISKIATRALKIARKHGDDVDALDIQLDLIAVHCNGCPLRLADLLKAQPFDFTHDVFGIHRNIDRQSGWLMNQFLPRYAQRKGDPK